MKIKTTFTDTVIPALLAVVLTLSLMVNSIQLRNYWEAQADNTAVVESVDYIEQAPKSAETKLTLTAPKDVSIGQLVEVSASTGPCKFVVKGVEPSNIRVLDHSVVFSSPIATTVDVFVAAVVGDSLIVEHVTVRVGVLGLPTAKPITPEPVTLKVELANLISDVESNDKQKELLEIAGAFKQVAVLIKAKAVTSAEDAVRITKTLVKKAVEKSSGAWTKVISRIEKDTEDAASNGELNTLEDHARHWEAISAALDPNP